MQERALHDALYKTPWDGSREVLYVSNHSSAVANLVAYGEAVVMGSSLPMLYKE